MTPFKINCDGNPSSSRKRQDTAIMLTFLSVTRKAPFIFLGKNTAIRNIIWSSRDVAALGQTDCSFVVNILSKNKYN